jgi:Asp/Glu/hydantoin racemase
MRLLLINPNTSHATTAAMVGIARESAPDITIDSMSAPFGVPLITSPVELAIAEEAVTTLMASRPPFGFGGVVVAAFGDPGVLALRRTLPVPVTGIAEAGMAEAAVHGRFAVVTTTHDLVDSIAALAVSYGHGRRFLGTVLTEGDVHALMANRQSLAEALRLACQRAIDELGAEAIIIGGGPLAVAARSLVAGMPVPLIEPVPAAVRLARQRAPVIVD